MLWDLVLLRVTTALAHCGAKVSVVEPLGFSAAFDSFTAFIVKCCEAGVIASVLPKTAPKHFFSVSGSTSHVT